MSITLYCSPFVILSVSVLSLSHGYHPTLATDPLEHVLIASFHHYEKTYSLHGLKHVARRCLYTQADIVKNMVSNSKETYITDLCDSLAVQGPNNKLLASNQKDSW